MGTKVKVSDLFFGLADGTMESQQDNFEELFYDHNSKYHDLMLNKEKFIVHGSKGLGKRTWLIM